MLVYVFHRGIDLVIIVFEIFTSPLTLELEKYLIKYYLTFVFVPKLLFVPRHIQIAEFFFVILGILRLERQYFVGHRLICGKVSDEQLFVLAFVRVYQVCGNEGYLARSYIKRIIVGNEG